MRLELVCHVHAQLDLSSINLWTIGASTFLWSQSIRPILTGKYGTLLEYERIRHPSISVSSFAENCTLCIQP